MDGESPPDSVLDGAALQANGFSLKAETSFPISFLVELEGGLGSQLVFLLLPHQYSQNIIGLIPSFLPIRYFK